MPTSSEELWNALTPAVLALQQDGEAMADPTKASHGEVELGKLLADMLGYDSPDDPMQARRLLTACGNDYDGLRKLVVAMRSRGDLEWVRARHANVYQVRACITKAYHREMRAEQERARLDTTEGRRARYAGHPGVVS